MHLELKYATDGIKEDCNFTNLILQLHKSIQNCQFWVILHTKSPALSFYLDEFSKNHTAENLNSRMQGGYSPVTNFD